MELLAPAGDMTKLKAALHAGADAVYFAGQDFGARGFAGNFTPEDLKEAVEYCHLLGKRAYVTVNTLIKDSEMTRLEAWIGHLKACCVDGLILQDVGVLHTAKSIDPDMVCHASTQMTLYTAEGLAFAKRHGIDRVVLAREVPLDVVKKLAEASSVETEVFVHGALCYAVSGQCLISSMIGGRSGNRGKCAQICRKTYRLQKDGQPLGQWGYFLSMKDLNTLDHMTELKDSGITALKIEGRMRSPEYVSTVVHHYRQQLDQMGLQQDLTQAQQELTAAFNRGFTKGYLLNEDRDQIVNTVSPTNQGVYVGMARPNKRQHHLTIDLETVLKVGDKLRVIDGEEAYGVEVFNIYWKGSKQLIADPGESVEVDFNNFIKNPAKVFKTYDSDLNLKMKERDEQGLYRVPLKAHFEARVGAMPVLRVSDPDGHQIEAVGDTAVQTAVKLPLTELQADEQFRKMGDTVYRLTELTCQIDAVAFLPVKQLNAMRREAVEKMDGIRKQCQPKSPAAFASEPFEKPTFNAKRGFEMVYYAHTPEQLEALEQLGVKQVFYYDVLALPSVRDRFKMTLYPALKAFYSQSVWERILESLVDEPLISVANAGQCEAFSDRILVLDTPMNLMNRKAVAFFNTHYTVKRAFLSMELNEEELEPCFSAYDHLGFYFKGRPLIMTSYSCPARTASAAPAEVCAACKGQLYSLIDEKNAVYPMSCLYGSSYLYHHTPIQMDDRLRLFADRPFRSLKVELTTESNAESLAFLETHTKAAFMGHFKRGVE